VPRIFFTAITFASSCGSDHFRIMKKYTIKRAAAFVSGLTWGLAIVFTAAQAAVPTGPPTFSDPLNISNVYHPFQPGARKMFIGNDAGKSAAALDEYLTETRIFTFNGEMVECRVLREFAFESGKLIEISDNYFAQADDGTVYYFGELVNIYENGVVANHEGSWLVGGPTQPSDPPETGIATEPTVFMPANPELGDVFKPEDLFPLVDETAEIVATEKTVNVPAGRYKNAIVVKESTRLSHATERKWYAAGVGVVLVRSKSELLKLTASTLEQPK
jgi:hypothetical protein